MVLAFHIVGPGQLFVSRSQVDTTKHDAPLPRHTLGGQAATGSEGVHQPDEFLMD